MDKLPVFILFFLLLILIGFAARGEDAPATSSSSALTIDLSQPVPVPLTGHLKMGGKNPAGVEITANSRYLTLGGRPWLPVMGEFHFTRYPRAEWETQLLKMKAGGITIVSTYVFWIHHEEVEGEFDWADDHDLRAFVELCAKHGLYSWVRLGPWCHGEVRNGGLPDWVLTKSGRNIRKEDPQFMGFTRTLYQQIFKQCQGLLWKDGGPIIGVQVDNEMANNPKYLLALKRLSQDVGFDVPMYSVTGWGSARFPADEVVPLFGGYADGFWEGGSTYSKRDRRQFFFTHVRDDSGIGADLMPATWHVALANEHDRYPYVTCECGGGMEISYARRPLMSADDVAALSFVKVGSGSNLPGYYMYQGGRNPKGKRSTLQESQATNYPNDMPVIRYDFQAPLGQYGQVRPSYDALRMIHTFLADFGEQLAPMPSILPVVQAKSFDDTQTLRWSARSDGTRGFLFINNYQRGSALPEKKDVQLTLKLASGEMKVPAEPVTIPSGAYMVWPFNMDLNGVKLTYATAQPLCKLDDAGTPCFVFVASPGMQPEFAIEGQGTFRLQALGASVTTVRGSGSTKANILLLTPEQAMHAYVADLQGARRLILSPDGNLTFTGNTMTLQSTNPSVSLAFFPRLERLSGTNGVPLAVPGAGLFARVTVPVAAKQVALEMKQVKPAGPAREVKIGSRKKPLPPDDADFDAAAVWQVSLPKDALDNVRDLRVRISYVGDVARAYVGDRLIDDNFYFGEPWEIGLKIFAPEILEKGLTIKVLPLRKDLQVYLPEDRRPTYDEKGEALDLRGVEAQPVYEVRMNATGNQ